MGRIYNRVSQLLLYTSSSNSATELDMSALDFDFEVRSSLPTKKDGKNHTEPITCKVDVYKLSVESRDKLSADGKGVELWTGYDDDMSMIFRGPIVNVTHQHIDGLDWVTSIYATDAWDDFSNSFFSRSYSTGESVSNVIDDVAGSFGLPVTNEWERTDTLLTGTAIFGRSKKLMDDLARDYDFSWSISAEQGVRVVDNLNPPLIDHTTVSILTSDTLLSSPSIEESIENEGKKDEKLQRRVHAACILNQNLTAGSVVQFKPSSFLRSFSDIETKAVTRINPDAYYVVQECIHRGTNRADADHSTEITTKEETV